MSCNEIKKWIKKNALNFDKAIQGLRIKLDEQAMKKQSEEIERKFFNHKPTPQKKYYILLSDKNLEAFNEALKEYFNKL